MAELFRLLLALGLGAAAGAWAVHARGLARSAEEGPARPPTSRRTSAASPTSPTRSRRCGRPRSTPPGCRRRRGQRPRRAVRRHRREPRRGAGGRGQRGRQRGGRPVRQQPPLADEVVSTLDQALEVKRGTLSDLRGLQDLNSEMKQMTAEVRRIAGQTHLLALNAAIEAVHVGAAGQAFGVVAVEGAAAGGPVGAVRRPHRPQGHRDRRRDRRGAGEGAGGRGARGRRREHGGPRGAGGARRLPGAGVRAAQAAERLARATSGAKSEVAGSLVDLQFQDPIGRVLEHLRDSVATLPGLVAASGAAMTPLDPQAVLADLAGASADGTGLAPTPHPG